MQSVKEAVEFYLPKKLNGEMSLSSIRQELKEKSDFTEEEIKMISASISDLELAQINNKKVFSLSHLDTNLFSYFMIIASLFIFAYSYWQYNALSKLSETTEVPGFAYLINVVFMIASSLYLVRHVVKIIKRR